jgi:hypothetical protein
MIPPWFQVSEKPRPLRYRVESVYGDREVVTSHESVVIWMDECPCFQDQARKKFGMEIFARANVVLCCKSIAGEWESGDRH